MQENLSAPAQNAPPDVKRYSAEEFEKITGIPRGTLRSWACRGQFAPAERNGRGKPSYYFESQIPAATALAKQGKHGTNKPANVVSLFDNPTNETIEANDYREDDGSNDDPDDVTEFIEVAPPADNDDDELQDPPADDELPESITTPAQILQGVDVAAVETTLTIETPAEIVTLDVRANRIRQLQADVQRGIIEIGFELIAAKKEISHGGWADWLKTNFDWTQQTANRFMRVAERFGKLNNVVQFKPATLQAMLALPEGDEEKFIASQAEAGKPIEKLSAREVQTAVKTWRKPKTENEEQEVKGEYIGFLQKAPASEPVPIKAAPEPPTVNQDNDAPELHETSLPPDVCLAIRTVIDTAALDDLKRLRDTLLKLAKEVESKIGELLKSTSGDSNASNAL